MHKLLLFRLILNKVLKTITSLRPGDSGIIKSIADSEVTPKLLDMGCMPGERVTMKYMAPMGGPVCVHLSGYDLILRIEEASKIELN